MATTLQQVADLAGVSLATASRVLNGSSRTPRPDVVHRVRTAARTLGYVANAQAQALARSSTGLVGLVVHDIADPYFSSIAAGVQAAARHSSRQMLLATTNWDPGNEYEAISAFMAYRTDAIILAGSLRVGIDSGQERLIELCTSYTGNGGRVATIGQPVDGFASVTPRNADGAAKLADALLAAGHRRFAMVQGPSWLRTSIDRCEAFRARIDAADGASVEWSVHTDFNRDGAYTAAREQLAGTASTNQPKPLCIFATTDMMALGVLSAARELGLNVPGQVGIAGFDDIDTLRDSSPSLTTVQIDLDGMGRAAAQLVTSAEVVTREFDATPVLRESTRID